MLRQELPADVLHIIFDLLSHKPDFSVLSTFASNDIWLHARCPQAAILYSVNLVNHAWHSVAQILMNRTIDLTISARNEERNLRVLHRLRQQADLQVEIRELVIRDVHTQLRIPLGIADLYELNIIDSEDEADLPHPTPEQQYFAADFIIPDIPEITLLRQLAAVQAIISDITIPSFTWAALTPIPIDLITTLAASSTDVHIKLNTYAIDTAKWSRIPVTNQVGLKHLLPIAGRLRTLEICGPSGNHRHCPILPALLDLLLACPNLGSLTVHALGGSPRNRQFWIKGINGPVTAKAQSALTADYHAWATGGGGSCRSTMYRSLLLGPFTPIHMPSKLASLSLRNICFCGLHRMDSVTINLPPLQALRRLDVSCLNVLKHSAENLQSLVALLLYLRQEWTDRTGSLSHTTAPPTCEYGWAGAEVTRALLKLPTLHELQVHGNPEALQELALLHHGKSLRKLILLHKQPYDRKVAYHSIYRQHTPMRIDQMPQVLDMIGSACPKLLEFACEAPNASTEFDLFLIGLTKSMLNLQSLHIHRSLEPYGDKLFATKFSYARFSKAGAIQVWNMLSAKLPLEQLKMTIGRLASWDELDSTMVAPGAESRTFVFQRSSSFNARHSALSGSLCPMYLESIEASCAAREGRPGPLLDYWEHQARLVDEFTEERNDPVYPTQHLVNGTETEYVNGMPPARFTTQEFEKTKEQIAKDFCDALQRQHEAERAEVTRPTRNYY